MTIKRSKIWIWHEDPGHAWLRVSLAELNSVGLTVDDITHFSYRKGDIFYLEEDCDGPTFLRAFKQKTGHDAHQDTQVSNSSSFIRDLPPCKEPKKCDY